MRLPTITAFSAFRHYGLWCLLLLSTSGVAANQAEPSYTRQPVAKVVLILDDIGYRYTDRQALALPSQVTFSVLPGAPLAQELAHKAQQQGRDIMVHMPMESQADKQLGPVALTSSMYPEVISRTTLAALDSLPMAIGVNNHMGSRLTEQSLPMQALMQAIKDRGLFFIDSRTTASTVAETVARNMGVPTDRRQVFIDHQHSPAFMQAQFARLIELARQQGSAIGIAHPHPQTLAFLQKIIPTLAGSQVKLVPVSELMAAPQNSPPVEQIASNVTAALP